MPRRDLHAAFVREFDRPELTVDHIKALCTRQGWKTGRTGCFEPGAVPPNKGKKMPYNANSARTQFKKGQLPKNTKFLGHERIDAKDGYVYVSVAETNPHTGFERRYVLKHKWQWEQANGPVPDGMCLKCLDGDKTNTNPSNWELIARAVNLRLNGRWSLAYDQAEPEVRPAVLAAAKLRCRTKELRRQGVLS